MKKYLIIYLCFLGAGLSISESFAQHQFLSTGGDIVGSNGQMSFSLGQLGFTVQASPSFSLLVGIQQPAGVITFPIELIYLRATPVGSYVNLSWATSHELNNNYFTIERSLSGLTWEIVDQVPSAGNSQEIKTYQLTDKSPYPGISYYRLKQTDLDGTFSYSDIVSTSLNTQEIQIYPNPSHDFLLLSLDQLIIETNFTLYNVKGERVKNQVLQSKETIINLQGLPEGIYHVVISTKSDVLKSSSILKK